MNWWLDNMPDSDRHTIVDCGYPTSPRARARADRLLRHVSKRNLCWGHCSRILIRIPPAKVKAILRAFPSIKEDSSYYACTHSYLGTGSTADVGRPLN